MSHYKSISLGTIPSIFYNHGYSEQEMITILLGLIEAWRLPGLHEGLTIGDVLAEMDLEPLSCQTLLLQASHLLTEVVNYVHAYASSLELLSWHITPYAVLLEIIDDAEVLFPRGERTALDGCTADAGGVSGVVSPTGY